MSDKRAHMESNGRPSPETAGAKDAERRRHRRYEFSIPVFVRILVEEETFQPKRLPGRSVNISAGGMLIDLTGLSKDLYKTMIRRQRMVRVHVQLPDKPDEVTFFGKIVWYDYQETNRGRSCLCGIAFETMEEREQEELNSVLRQLEAEAEA